MRTLKRASRRRRALGRALEALESRLFSFLLHFAHDNELQVIYQADAIASLIERPPQSPNENGR